MPSKFFEQDVKPGLKDKRKLSVFLEAQMRHYLPDARKITLNYIFCTDDYLVVMNNQYLGHDTLTDIITFDLSDNEKDMTGEIYISVERVKENAAKYGVSYTDELHRVIFHGALHLCGFKDKKEAEKLLMRAKEGEWLEKYRQLPA